MLTPDTIVTTLNAKTTSYYGVSLREVSEEEWEDFVSMGTGYLETHFPKWSIARNLDLKEIVWTAKGKPTDPIELVLILSRAVRQLVGLNNEPTTEEELETCLVLEMGIAHLLFGIEFDEWMAADARINGESPSRKSN